MLRTNKKYYIHLYNLEKELNEEINYIIRY